MATVPDAFPDTWAGALLNHIGAANVFTPNAASVSVSGRVTDANGRALPKASVLLIASDGNVRTVLTNPFGYFEFDRVGVGEICIFQVSAKGYTFNPQVITPQDNIDDLNFIAQ